jgi:tetratricopeptide (TPR) repeat protein
VLPFHLSLAIDPLTRASQIYLEEPKRGGTAAAHFTPAARFRQHLDTAIMLYREALTHDPDYLPSALNLGGALIVRGAHSGTQGLNADFSEAVTTLLRTLERAPDTTETPAILNSLGVALFYVRQLDHAREHLTRALASVSTYADPLYNLGHMARTEGRQAEAQHYWTRYRQLQPSASPLAPGQSPERILGRTIGRLESHIPVHWGAPVKGVLRLGDEELTVATYPTGAVTLLQDGEIIMMLAREGFQGTSQRGITIGSAGQQVLAHYGPPSRQMAVTQGQSWAYDTQRIAFQLRDGKVVSWLIF